MSLKQKILLKILPSLVSGVLKMLVATWRVDRVDEAEISPDRRNGRQIIYAFWHNQIIPGVGIFSNQDIQSMASRSFDGEIIARALVKLGFPYPSRGSTSRGGGSALKELAESVRAGRSAVLTPDGPRGPRHVAKKGALALASLTGVPFVAAAIVGKRVVRLKGWDRMEIPWPFTRVAVAFSDPIFIPGGMNESQTEEYRQRTQLVIENTNRRAAERVNRKDT